MSPQRPDRSDTHTLDISQNGLIEREEIETVLRKISLDVRPEDVDKLYASAAGDTNGQIDFGMFGAVCVRACVHPDTRSLTVQQRPSRRS